MLKLINKHFLVIVFLFSFTKLLGATTYYVSTTGSDQPGRGTSAGNAWLTLPYAISQVPAGQGNTIQVAAGTYLFSSTLNVPLGINIIGAGADLTIFKATTAFEYPREGYNFDHVLIQLSPGNNSGNQVLSDFRIDGNGKKLWGGIYVRDRNQVEIKNVKLYGVYYTGIWYWGVKDCSIHDAYFENCAWGNTGFQTGCINMGNIQNGDFYNITIREGLTGSPSTYGYGIKVIGPGDNESFLINVKLHDSDIDVNNIGIWNAGQAPNMSAEWHKVKLLNCEIYNNIIADNLSLVNDNPPRYNQPNEISVRVHDNKFMLTGGYALELTEKNCEIDHNFFNGQPYPITTWDRVIGSSGGWKIHHNTFLNNVYHIIRAEYGLQEMDFYNNSVYVTTTNLDQIVEMVHNACGNFNISNNAFYYSGIRVPTLVDVSNNATTSNVTASNNCMFGVVRGNHVDTYTNNLENTNPNFSLSGDLPSPFFTLKDGSPCINAGKTLNFSVPDGLPDIGAYEHGSIHITPPAIQFKAPVSGQVLTEGPVTLVTNVTSPESPVAIVEFFSGTNKVAEATKEPYQYTTPALPVGNYNYHARAIDIYGNVSSFADLNLTVQGADGNMIINGEFDAGLTAWQLDDYTGPNYTKGTDTAYVTQSANLSGANAATVHITSTDNQNFTIQLSQQPTTFRLVKGHTYQISFDAKAVTARPITVAIRGTTTNTDFFNQTVSLTASAAAYGPYTYVCNDDNVLNEKDFSFSFYLAKGVLSDVFLDKVFVKDIMFKPVAVTNVMLNPQTLTLAVADTSQLGVLFSPANATNQNITWASDNPAVAIVGSTGTVKALSPGTATITVTSDDGAKTASTVVIVNSQAVPVAVTSVSASPSTLTLIAGNTGVLTATVYPSNASNKAVSWTSSDNSIATINNSGTVSAISAGTAIITVTSQDGSYTATSSITVNAAPVLVTSVSMIPSAVNVDMGATTQLMVTVSPANATNKSVTYISDNTAFATVDANGLVTGIAAGIAHITVSTTDGGKSAVSTITVTAPAILITGITVSQTSATMTSGTTLQLIATITPGNATNQNVGWVSSDPIIATVNSSGLITALKAGNATVTVSAQDGNATATSQITVVEPVVPDQKFTLYPNPANGVMHIRVPDLGGNTLLQIYNQSGQLVSNHTANVQNGITDVNVTTLPNGIYLLKVSGEKGSQSKKFIVTR